MAQMQYSQGPGSNFYVSSRHYLNGMGAEKHDLAAMYWFGRAAGKGEQESLMHREGLLNAYRQNLGDTTAKEQLDLLIYMCTQGCETVPVDPRSANYWRERKKEIV